MARRRPGRIRQAAVRRARRCACLSVALHPPRRHLKQPPDRPRRKVTFKDKDYRAKDGDMQKTMALPIAEFIRRFLNHVLPSGPLMFRTYVALSSASYVLGRFEEGLAYARKAAKLNHTALCQQRASREPGTSAPVARHAGPRRRGRRQPNRRWVLNPLASLPHKSIAAVDSRLGIFRLVTERAQRSARNSRLDSGIQPP